VMRHAADDRHGWRVRAMIVVLWRAGLRVQEAIALAEHDLDHRRGSLLVRNACGWRSAALEAERAADSRRSHRAYDPRDAGRPIVPVHAADPASFAPCNASFPAMKLLLRAAAEGGP
jgi:integrase